MKKITLLFLFIGISILLSACTQSMISTSGYDLTDLEICIDSMVEENSNEACSLELRESLLEDYIRSFETDFNVTDSQYQQTRLDYSISKDETIERIEFWVQYSLLPSNDEQANYDLFKGFAETIQSELRSLNDVPEFIFTIEYLFLDDFAYKYHNNLNDELSQVIIIWDMDELFTNTVVANEAFIMSHINDEDLLVQEFIFVTNDFNASISVFPQTDTYTHNVYFEDDDALITTAEAEAFIESEFNAEGLTLE